MEKSGFCEAHETNCYIIGSSSKTIDDHEKRIRDVEGKMGKIWGALILISIEIPIALVFVRIFASKS